MRLRSIFLALFILLLAASPGEAQRSLEDSLIPMEQYARQAMADWSIPGMAVAVVHGDETVYAKGFGVRILGGSEPVDTETIFQIGSVSKSFTATLAAMLADDNAFSWRDSLTRHLAGFQMYDPWVTGQFQVLDLMTQHSGLPSHAGDAQMLLGFDRDHIMRSLRFIRPVTSFRSQFAYQNSLFIVTGLLIERLSGEPWEASLKKRILDPLGMAATTTRLTDIETATNAAKGHWKIKEVVQPIPADWPYRDWVYVAGPAGGINSTVSDMAKWVSLQIGKGEYKDTRLVSRENLEMVHDPITFMFRTPEGFPVVYAQGWAQTLTDRGPIIWHNGATSGYKSVVAYYPRYGIGLVVLTNLTGNMVPESVAMRLFDLLSGGPLTDYSRQFLDREKEARDQEAAEEAENAEAKAAKDKETAEKAKEMVPEPPIASFAGTYTNSIYGDAVVKAEDGNLIITLGPKPVNLSFTRSGPLSFTGEWLAMPGETETAIFQLNPENAPESLVLSNLNEDGTGVFKRALD